jgi:hypothetical protein
MWWIKSSCYELDSMQSSCDVCTSQQAGKKGWNLRLKVFKVTIWPGNNQKLFIQWSEVKASNNMQCCCCAPYIYIDISVYVIYSINVKLLTGTGTKTQPELAQAQLIKSVLFWIIEQESTLSNMLWHTLLTKNIWSNNQNRVPNQICSSILLIIFEEHQQVLFCNGE